MSSLHHSMNPNLDPLCPTLKKVSVATCMNTIYARKYYVKNSEAVRARKLLFEVARRGRCVNVRTCHRTVGGALRVRLGSVCQNGVTVYADRIFDCSGSIVRIDKPIPHLDTCGRRHLSTPDPFAICLLALTVARARARAPSGGRAPTAPPTACECARKNNVG